MENEVESRKDTKGNVVAILKLTSQSEGKTNSSSFQSIYTSILTNEISLKGADEKKSEIIKFKGETNRIEQEGRG